MLRLICLALAALIGFASPAAAQNKFKYDEKHKGGVLVIETEPNRLPYTVDIRNFEVDKGRLTQSPFKGNLFGMPQMGQDAERRFHFVRFPPGTYAISGVRQTQWGACFNGGTVRFDIKPGQVTYIGRIDAKPGLDALAAAVRAGKMPAYAQSNQYYYVFDEPRPALTPPAEAGDWQTPLKAWLAVQYPNVTAPLAAAELTSAAFGTGRDAFGTQRICGGYYSKSAEQPD